MQKESTCFYSYSVKNKNNQSVISLATNGYRTNRKLVGKLKIECSNALGKDLNGGELERLNS